VTHDDLESRIAELERVVAMLMLAPTMAGVRKVDLMERGTSKSATRLGDWEPGAPRT
jgi:hypothetical protein